MFNQNALAAKMDRAGDTHYALAAALGMSKTNFSAVWNGRTKWQTKHIVKVAVRYNLTPDEVWNIFFAAEAEEERRNNGN